MDGYTGPLLRVRDTTTNAESDLGIDTDGEVVPFSGAPPAVVKVYDQSGNGADIGQTDTTRQPLLIYEATKNGFAAIRIRGSSGAWSGSCQDSPGCVSIRLYGNFW
ncbi:MAG: hypothetical protein DI533_20235 [Cereibacter sphaeroides]|uniref:Uncharacterized protein n=1 Tax=Cereibacter sphaeroides TaxID=1063 RepID=A0A2W5S237_CERSP|nr:MAG: hypothetical protein DI533_20235 [Cereibacter sphaeroides]